MRTLLKAVLGVVLLLAGAAVALTLYVDRIAKRGIEYGGTRALGVETTLEDADLGLFAGELDLDRLRVRNPDGYEAPYFLSLDEGSAAVALRTVRSDVIEVPRLALRGIDLNLERHAGKANYLEIIENLKRLGASATAPAGPPGGGDAAAPSERRFLVRDVRLRDIALHVNLLPVAGDLGRIDLQIPEIRLADVGSGGAGASTAELIGALVRALLETSVRVAGEKLPGDVLAELKGGLEELRRTGTEVLAETRAEAEHEIEAARERARAEIEAAKQRAREELEAAKRRGAEELEAAKRRAATEAAKVRRRLERELERGLDDLLGTDRDRDEDGEPVSGPEAPEPE